MHPDQSTFDQAKSDARDALAATYKALWSTRGQPGYYEAINAAWVASDAAIDAAADRLFA